MIILHDPVCAEYGSHMRPEQPARVIRSATHLRTARPEWEWRSPAAPVEDSVLLAAHTPALLERITREPDIDADTPCFPGIAEHARRAVAGALDVAALARAGSCAFSLMRPPGHHATRNQAMGFCYLNQIAVAALASAAAGARVAVWDFDAHHGNGTEDILEGRAGVFFASVHQFPGYPGTGTRSSANCKNFPVPPHTPREGHMTELARSWEAVRSFQPDLVLVSAGFDAYAGDPITEMTLELEDFAQLGRWLHDSGFPAAAVLEGGYSPELPQLLEAFLGAWDAA